MHDFFLFIFACYIKNVNLHGKCLYNYNDVNFLRKTEPQKEFFLFAQILMGFFLKSVYIELQHKLHWVNKPLTKQSKPL